MNYSLSNDNPLLNLQNTKPIDFAKILERKGIDFLPALEYYKKITLERIEKIKSEKEPDFENTILALELSNQEIQECASAYYVLFNSECIPEIQELALTISEFLANLSNDIYLDDILFQKVNEVYQTKKGIQSKEQNRLLEIFWKQFKRNGALLNKESKKRIREIDLELSQLSPKFSENLLKATNQFELHITDENDLRGLPENLLAQGRENAKIRNKEGYIFTLQFPEYLPFITYCENSELRRKMYIAYRSRAYQGETNNTEIIKKILKLREERANLLGYKNHSEYVLEERMAKNQETVMNFLEELYNKVYPYALKEIEELKNWVKENLNNSISEIQPWDYRYYFEKMKKQKFQFHEESLRPYFPLENVIKGIFEVAKRLYNYSFKETSDVSLYHPDVRVFQVFENNEFLGLLYLDLFPRKTKRSGAWMTTIREQGLMGDQILRPHIGIVCNFTKPLPDLPSLLTFDEVKTLFHEFGHALHALSSKVTFRSLAGTNVYWDFVELPSQIMENWIKEKETLHIFAQHYKTKEPIPEEIIQKIKDSENFQAGVQFLTQLQYGFLDMYFHITRADEIQDIKEFEQSVTEKTRIFKEPEEVCISTGFAHIFAGGYSAGYYSYKWAEVLEADAFEFFKEKGIFNQDVAGLFKNYILEKGNTEDPMDLYIQFRGRKPHIDSLLNKFHLIKPDGAIAR